MNTDFMAPEKSFLVSKNSLVIGANSMSPTMDIITDDPSGR